MQDTEQQPDPSAAERDRLGSNRTVWMVVLVLLVVLVAAGLLGGKSTTPSSSCSRPWR